MYTIGADPEFFISDNYGRVVPVIGLLGGTKEKPVPVLTAEYNGFAVQEDNVMAEYNIPPAIDPGSFSEFVAMGRRAALNRIRERLPGAELFPESSATFSSELLAHPQAQVFGCSPDFDAYNMGAPLPRIQPPSLYVEGGAWRFAGGHIHLGYKAMLTWSVPDFVVASLADVFLSVVMLAYGADQQGERRKWYGTPGRYRPTPYGIEYRVLSNRWTMSELWARLAGRAAFNLMSFLSRGEEEVRRAYNDIPWNDVRATISSEDTTMAQSLRTHARDFGLEVA